MIAEARTLGVDTPKTYLTLSEAGEVQPEADRSAAACFEDLLELHDRALARGYVWLAEAYADRIVDEMTAGLARWS